MKPWHVSILIPARNEELLLPRCLRSVLAATAALPAQISHDIVLVADCSTDRTFRIAQRMLRGRGYVLSTDAGLVGVARAIAAKAALGRCHKPLHQCWLANTDADCIVPETWLLDQLTVAEAGGEALAGIVGVDSFAEHQSCVGERFRNSYVIHPDGTHPHVHGANIGVRADAYLRAGGWGELATAEDHDLWGRLQRTGAKRLSLAQMKVITSGRRVGRAPLGFAGALAAHNDTAHYDTPLAGAAA